MPKVFKGYVAAFFDEEIKQVAEKPAYDLYSLKRYCAAEENNYIDSRVFRELDQFAFFFRFFFACLI